MKRTSLKRYTPLRTYRELVRKAWERKPSKSKRRYTPAVPADVREALTERSGGWCEIRLPGCSRIATDPHHRLARKMGGRKGRAAAKSNSLSNLVHACRPCHQYVTSPVAEHRQYALDTGLIVLEHEDPGEVILTTPAFPGPVRLGDCGSVWPADLSPIDVETQP